jgi:adenosylmethionine-8-amino-7-oxononanoate aminotransferase
MLDREVAEHPAVAEIRLQGLMGAVELRAGDDHLLPRRVAAAMVDRGVLTRSMGSVITIVPPLTTTTDELRRIVDALGAALNEVRGR